MTLGPNDQVEIAFTARIHPPVGSTDPLPNQAHIDATDRLGNTVADLSDDQNSGYSYWSNPNNPGSGQPTLVVPPPELPAIGAAKTVTNVSTIGDGTFDVAYSIVVQNTGNTDLHDLQLADTLGDAAQLGTAFQSVTVAPVVTLTNTSTRSVIPTANAAYAGTGGLLAGTDGLLAPGDSYSVAFTVRVNPNAAGAPSVFNNRGPASGLSVSNSPVSDLTENGTDPTLDPNDPVDGTPTPVTPPASTPAIGAAKAAGTPALNADGTFDVAYSIVVQNTGNTDLHDLQLADTLGDAAQLGTAFQSVTVAPVVTLTNTSTRSVIPTANAAYAGTGGLLAGTDGLLAPGDSYSVAFTVRVNPNAAGAPSVFNNQALASGLSVSNSPVSDLTENGTDPTLDPNDPVDGTPTPVTPPASTPAIGAAKAAGTPALNADGTFDVAYSIVVQNTGNATCTTCSLRIRWAMRRSLARPSECDSCPVVTLTNTSTRSVIPTANAAYAGTGGLLAGTDGLLAPGDSYSVAFTVRVNPNAAGAPSVFNNQALASGLSVSNSPVSDLTENGTDPTLDPNDPVDGTPTPVTPPASAGDWRGQGGRHACPECRRDV
ncbi:MAG: hypothetical protein U1E15_12025 [Hyphomicrobiales bacterium]